MPRRIRKTRHAAIALLLVPAALLIYGGIGREPRKVEAGAAEDCYKFAAPLDALMGVLDDVFAAMPKQIEAKKFKNLRREAYYVAEMANLATHVKEHRDNKEWLSFAASMKEGALKLAEAAKNKDEKEAQSLHAAIEKACESCHEKFRDN